MKSVSRSLSLSLSTVFSNLVNCDRNFRLSTTLTAATPGTDCFLNRWMDGWGEKKKEEEEKEKVTVVVVVETPGQIWWVLEKKDPPYT